MFFNSIHIRNLFMVYQEYKWKSFCAQVFVNSFNIINLLIKDKLHNSGMILSHVDITTITYENSILKNLCIFSFSSMNYAQVKFKINI